MKRNILIRIIVVVLVLAMVASLAVVFAGCGDKSGNKTGSVFKLARTWDRTGIRYHYNGGSSIGGLAWLACEPLIQYVRTTDEVYYLLAESVEHKTDHTSILKVRKGVKWHNGDDFTADDVIAYYSIVFTTVTNYLSKMIEKVDDYTVKYTWKTWMEPDAQTKTLLIALDKVGTVPYSIFHEFTDEAQRILSTQRACAEGYYGWAPYGKMNDAASDTLYTANWKAFANTNPEVFCATGPYKLKKLTQTQMILEKNEDYYFVDQIPYETVICYNISDLSTIYNMLLAGELDYQDGFAPDTTIDQITEDNPTMVHLKAYDPASVGMLFNLEKPIWTDKVREAFQYLFNREEMKNSANKYAITSYYPLGGYVSTEAKKFMTEEDFNNIPQYSYNETKATQLLEEAGWEKIDGSWYKDSVKIELTLGYDGSNAIMSSLAEAVQGALKSFGIGCKLKRAADWGTWFSLASAEDSYYDFTVNWTELGTSFAHPVGAYKFMFTDQNGPVMHLPKLTQEDITTYGIAGYEVGNVNLYLNKHDGTGKFHAYEYVNKMYSMSESELQSAVADLVYGIGALNYGVNFFQNVSGGFYNSAVIGNLPMSEYWSTGSRNVTAVPEMYSEEYFACARCSLEFASAAPLIFQYSDAALAD